MFGELFCVGAVMPASFVCDYRQSVDTDDFSAFGVNVSHSGQESAVQVFFFFLVC